MSPNNCFSKKLKTYSKKQIRTDEFLDLADEVVGVDLNIPLAILNDYLDKWAYISINRVGSTTTFPFTRGGGREE